MVQQAKKQFNTGTENQQYDLISLIYHSLQSAAVCETYINDAQQSGDQELKQFFQEVKDNSCQTAERAKKLMAQRLG